jgi:ATP-dependent Clp protease ATP-binding subunit ClpC
MASDAIAQFISRTGLPELFLRDEIPLGFDDVVATLHRDVIGQENACRAAASVITTFKAGLNDPNRPLGVLLFCGPTGVGKTQLAQSIGKYLYGASVSDAKRMIRLDMSEYANLDAADRFLGSPQSGPAEWIQKIRQQPFTVLLLDEIEKASPDIFDVLLGVFDEGRLTDAWGRLTYFRSAVIIMTSNLGAGVAEPFGLAKSAPAAYDSEAAGFFRPEFYNRIDSVVTFSPLSAEVVRKITEKELMDLAAREGFAKANLKLRFGERLIDHLAQVGFDARYGARPLQRAVEQTVVTALARWLIENPQAKDATLKVDLIDGNVAVRRD